MDVFAAQHAVDVVDTDLDVAQPALLDDFQRVSRRLDLARIHLIPPNESARDRRPAAHTLQFVGQAAYGLAWRQQPQ